ncbi:MAG: hypothetical protein CK540_04450 [Thermoleophilia bacterium]|nr:MAG: hypothetical protein CK540_04450 [Thermoleophilia bacterium]
MSTPEPRRGLTIWLLIALPLVLQFAFVGLAASIASLVTTLPDGATTFTNLPQALVLFSAYVVFAAAIWLVARHLGSPTAVLVIRRTPLGRSVALSVVAFVAIVAASAALEPVFHGAESQDIAFGAWPSSPGGLLALVVSGVTIVAAAALTEELYFRGLLYGQLDRRWGVAAAVVWSAGVFGLAHFEPNAFPSLFVLGLILGLLRLRTQSFWPGAAVHAANNLLAFVALLLAVN